MLSEAARYNYIMSWYVILNYEPLPEAVINYDSCRNSAQLVMPKISSRSFLHDGTTCNSTCHRHLL